MRRSNNRVIMKNLLKATTLLLAVLFVGCNSDDDNQNPDPDNPVIVDLTDANLTDFKFAEVAHTDIQIQHPEIVDGKEQSSGEIIITVPATSDILSLSLESVNFDTTKFKISPEVGAVQSFEAGSSVNYTITSLEDPEKSMSYLVFVKKEGDPDPLPEEKLEITSFKFEQSKNSDLTSDIEAKKIVMYPNSTLHAIFILVPEGTDLTSLVPTVGFNGETLEYKQGDGDLVAYPTADLSVDFTSDYGVIERIDRNEFQLVVSKSDERQRYRVIVDVENPVALEQNSISSPGIIEGDSRVFVFNNWTNKGNHPIQTNIEAVDFVDNTTDGIGNIFSNAYLEPEDGISSYIMPGQEGRIRVVANTTGAAVGDYDVNIVFSPKYDVNRAMINDIRDDLNPIEDIFNKVQLNVKTKVLR